MSKLMGAFRKLGSCKADVKKDYVGSERAREGVLFPWADCQQMQNVPGQNLSRSERTPKTSALSGHWVVPPTEER